VTLALEVAGAEKFESRYIATSDPAKPGTVTQHLLDGQQRLTAFWRSMHNNYEWETFFVYLPQFDRGDSTAGAEAEIRCVPRWENKHQASHAPMGGRARQVPGTRADARLVASARRPRHGDRHLADPGHQAAGAFPHGPGCSCQVQGLHGHARSKIKAEITTLRERVTHFNLPYLSLPADTSKDVALQVFINMNTNSKPSVAVRHHRGRGGKRCGHLAA
jgi:hypothetical protein